MGVSSGTGAALFFFGCANFCLVSDDRLKAAVAFLAALPICASLFLAAPSKAA